MTGQSLRPFIIAAARGIAPGRLSIREAARQAGCAQSTVHAHFGGVAGLRAALAEPVVELPPIGPTREAQVLALFADGERLVARDVADDLGWTLQLATSHLHRLFTLGRLTRRRAGGAYLYTAVRS